MRWCLKSTAKIYPSNKYNIFPSFIIDQSWNTLQLKNIVLSFHPPFEPISALFTLTGLWPKITITVYPLAVFNHNNIEPLAVFNNIEPLAVFNHSDFEPLAVFITITLNLWPCLITITFNTWPCLITITLNNWPCLITIALSPWPYFFHNNIEPLAVLNNNNIEPLAVFNHNNSVPLDRV